MSSIKVRLYLIFRVLVLCACLVNHEENSTDYAASHRSQHVLPEVFSKMFIFISRELALLETDIDASEDWVEAS